MKAKIKMIAPEYDALQPGTLFVTLGSGGGALCMVADEGYYVKIANWNGELSGLIFNIEDIDRARISILKTKEIDFSELK